MPIKYPLSIALSTLYMYRCRCFHCSSLVRHLFFATYRQCVAFIFLSIKLIWHVVIAHFAIDLMFNAHWRQSIKGFLFVVTYVQEQTYAQKPTNKKRGSNMKKRELWKKDHFIENCCVYVRVNCGVFYCTIKISHQLFIGFFIRVFLTSIRIVECSSKIYFESNFRNSIKRRKILFWAIRSRRIATMQHKSSESIPGKEVGLMASISFLYSVCVKHFHAHMHWYYFYSSINFVMKWRKIIPFLSQIH